MAKKKITGRPGLFGTVYYYDENGNPVGKSRPGFLAKEVFTDTEHNYITSYDSLLGEVHFKNGMPIGHTRPGFFDSAYTTLDEENKFVEDEYCDEDLYVEEDEEELLEGYKDEELEDAEYEEYSPKVSQYTIVRNLQIFVLCLVICMVAACIYAIVRFN